MEYTKEDWKVDGNTIYALNRKGYNRFQCHISQGHDDNDEWITDEEVKADVRLIVAAPAMYEALKLYLSHQEGKHGHYCGLCHDTIEQAIKLWPIVRPEEQR